MARIIWATPAVAQLEAIATAIEVDKPLAAQATVRQVYAEINKLAAFPMLGRVIPEFRRPGYRHLWVKPCWIYYRVNGDDVIILHIRRAEKLLDLDDLG